jgi:hypothetical protein
MTLEEAFRLINNLDVREALRRHAPQWSTVVVSETEEILDIIRHKEEPTPELHLKHMKKYPTSAQFTAWPGRFDTVEELRKQALKSARIRQQY